mgnify:FL=1
MTPFGRAPRWRIRKLRALVGGVIAWERSVNEPDRGHVDVPFHIARTSRDEVILVRAVQRSFDRIVLRGSPAVGEAVAYLTAMHERGRTVCRHVDLYELMLTAFRLQRIAVEAAEDAERAQQAARTP